MSRFDWNAEALRLAEYVGEEIADFRGVLHYSDGELLIVFGNDGYGSDQRTVNQVSEFRKYVTAINGKVLGFAVEKDGNSWAMIISGLDENAAKALLFTAWSEAYCCADDEPFDSMVMQAGVVEGLIDRPQPCAEN